MTSLLNKTINHSCVDGQVIDCKDVRIQWAPSKRAQLMIPANCDQMVPADGEVEKVHESEKLIIGGSDRRRDVFVSFEHGELALSTAEVRDAHRWRNTMPSLAEFASIVFLDLHRSQFITSLDDSIGQMADLRNLKLTSCSRLESLPESIGALSKLEEVRKLNLGVHFCAIIVAAHSTLSLPFP